MLALAYVPLMSQNSPGVGINRFQRANKIVRQVFVNLPHPKKNPVKAPANKYICT